MAASDNLTLIKHKILNRHGPLHVSGLARLLEATESTLNAIDYVDRHYVLSITNSAGVATARLPRRLVPLIAAAYIAGPSEEFRQRVNAKLWQFAPADGSRPLATLPINVAIWRLAGLGEEVVPQMRDTEFSDYRKSDVLHYSRAVSAVKFGVLDDQTAADFATAVYAQACPNRNIVMGWLKYDWRINGTTLEGRAELKRLVKNEPRLSTSTLMFMASYFCDAGEYDYALILLNIARLQSKSAWSSHRYVANTHLLVEQGLLNSTWAIKEAQLFKRFNAQQSDFGSLIRRNLNSFALVANGQRQTGLGTGPLIDSKNVVIRMNSARPDGRFAADYGWKQNVWVKNTPNYDVKRLEKLGGIEMVLLSGKNPLYHEANIGPLLQELMDTYPSVSSIPDQFTRQTIAATKRNPSSGLVMLTWLQHLAGELQDQRNVFGYGLSDQKTREASHYFRDKPVISHHTHSWPAERKYYDSIVKPHELGGKGLCAYVSSLWPLKATR